MDNDPIIRDRLRLAIVDAFDIHLADCSEYQTMRFNAR
jgi:hypothetical protein